MTPNPPPSSVPPRPPPHPVALLTDFGPASMYVGALHGVIAARTPEVRVIDLAHDIPPRNVGAAALSLEAAVNYFPRPTVFCCVVDPGVGTERRALAAFDAHHFFVAPDNGLLTLVEQAAAEEGRKWRVGLLDPRKLGVADSLSATFHGRDLFAPAAAELARGGGETFERLLSPCADWKRLDIPEPVVDPRHGTVTVHALAADSFGNIITTLRRMDWTRIWKEEKGGAASDGAGGEGSHEGKGAALRTEPDPAEIEIRLADERWRGIARTFGDVEPGRPVAYWGSGGRLEIGLRDGNAAARFSIVQGAPVTLLCAFGPRAG